MEKVKRMVSIIVPIYNAERYLDVCIESLIKQTYKDIEILLIDDGSTDQSADICCRYSAQDSRIRYIYQENQGVSVARNNGLNASKGAWICFVDSDDWASTDMVETLLADAQDNDIVIGDVFVTENEVITRASFFPMNYSYERKKAKCSLLGNAIGCNYYGSGRYCFNVGVPWARIYRRNFLFENNIEFPIGIRRKQDTIFNINAFLRSPKMHFCQHPIYYYRCTEDSACRRYDPNFEQVIQQIITALDQFIKNDDDPEVRKLYDYQIVALLLENITLQYSHPKCPLPNKDRVAKMKLQFTKKEYVTALRNCDRKLMTFKQRLIVNLLLLHLYRMVLRLYKIKLELSQG